MMLVKVLRGIIFGIDDDRENAKLGSRRSRNCVCKQGRAKAFPLPTLCNRKPAEQSGRDYRIPREFPDDLGRKLIESDSRGAERVVTSDFDRLDAHSDEAGGDTPPDVLRSVLEEITVKKRRPALESRAIMAVGERLNAKRTFHR